jgi:hypothetical protein
MARLEQDMTSDEVRTMVCFQLCSRLAERSQDAENQLKEINHPADDYPALSPRLR